MGVRPSFVLRRRQTCKGLLALAVGVGGCESVGSTPPKEGAPGNGTAGAPAPLEVHPFADPSLDGTASIESVLAARRSVRNWTGEALTKDELGQLLWAAQGTTDASGKRTCPSAGALYPLETYVLTRDGIHHYRPDGHALALMSTEDVRARVPAQDFVHEAPAIFVITAVFARTEEKYGTHAERFVHLEAGHAAHGLILQAVAMGLGGTTVGGFDLEELMTIAALPVDHEPVYVVPVGHPA